MRRPLIPLLALLALLAGCAGRVGALGIVSPDPDAVSTKLLRPGATGRSCGVSILGVAREPGKPSLEDALRTLMALDAEGNVITHVDVRRDDLLTGVYNRRCVEVRGDLGRIISTVVVQHPAGHAGHH